jgi:hypothetical protein
MPNNNLIEQDHRSIKLRLGPMLGVKRFRCASITIDGLEFTHRILGLTMAASYSVLMVRGEAEIGNSYGAQRSDGSSSVSRPRNIQIANINGGSHQVLSQIACAFGNDTIMQRENSESSGFATIETSEPEAALFALAEQVDLAEKAFHNALVCRNEAQIGPSPGRSEPRAKA